MAKPLLEKSNYLDAYIKTVQYIGGLTSQQDVWSEVAKALASFFRADLVAFAERGVDGKIAEPNWTFSDQARNQSDLESETKEAVLEVLESGFLTSQIISTPEPLSIVFLPVTLENCVTAVMLVGHEMSEPLPKELLNGYLAVSVLVGETATRLVSEIELKRYRLHLEQLVEERTKELASTNEHLEEANEKLTKAIAEVSTLSGLIPICASCKKIRDDSGYWNQIEQYISDRSDAQFTHGICPECSVRLYGEDFNLDKK